MSRSFPRSEPARRRFGSRIRSPWRSGLWLVACLLAGWLALVPTGAFGQSIADPLASEPILRPPTLIFEAPPVLEGRRQELLGFEPDSLLPIMDLVGLEEPGPPIRIRLVEEGSLEARRAPSWSIAYAIGNAGLVVLMPSRVPTYPDGNLEQVLRHEIAHVLIDRAAGRHGVPRWFHEGVAIIAAREWRFEDRSRLVLEAFRRRSASMSDVELEFSGGSHSASRAYAVSAAFVRYLQEEEGNHTVARVLDFVAEGKRFRFAFREATGKSLTDVEAAFWQDFDFWNRWVPFITSSTALWMVVSFLAVLAWRRRRQVAEERMQAWDDEEAEREKKLIEKQIIEEELRRLERARAPAPPIPPPIAPLGHHRAPDGDAEAGDEPTPPPSGKNGAGESGAGDDSDGPPPGGWVM